MRFRILEGRLKYEFIVHPGGRVDDIRLRYDGAADIRLHVDGGMDVLSPLGVIRESAPVTYQNSGHELSSAFLLDGSDVSFAVQQYDHGSDLIIDPWATYLGGSGNDLRPKLTLDASGNVLICGGTQSLDFPVQNAVQSVYNGGAYDGIIAKIASSGGLLWATYYGGNEGDLCSDISTNSSGSIAVSGLTNSMNFPVQNPIQASNHGNGDAFVIRLTAFGTVDWATYFGGSNVEAYSCVAMDANGNIYAGTSTLSTDFPLKNAFQTARSAYEDMGLFKLSASGALEWSTYYGAAGEDWLNGIDVDTNGNPVFCASSNSSNILLVNPTHSMPVAGVNLIIGRMSPAGNLIWSTCYGGDGQDGSLNAVGAADVACGPDALVAVTAKTTSTNLPLKHPAQVTLRGNADVLIAVFDSAGRFVLGSYLGGSNDDDGNGITFDNTEKIVCVGRTQSDNFPLIVPQQSNLAGAQDAFLTRLDTNGVIDWSTYYGGSQDDAAMCVGADNAGRVIAVGNTMSADFPVLNPIQSTYAGSQDIMILSLFVSGGTITPPAAPTNLGATPLSPTKVRLTWVDNADNETRYVIEHQSGNDPWGAYPSGPQNVPTYTATNLAPQTVHRFRVKAGNAQFESAYSNTADATTPAFIAPSNLKVTTISVDEVGLLWNDNSANESHFIVEHMVAGGAWEPRDTLQPNTTTFVVPGLIPSTNYSFRVLAIEDVYPSEYSNIATATTEDMLAPTELQATAVSFEEVRLHWKDNTPYELLFIIEMQPSGGVWVPYDTVPANREEWIVTGLTATTEYWFRIKAVRNVYSSGYSNTAQALTKAYLPAPGNLTATLVSQNEVRLDWEDRSNGETGFEIERRLDGEDWVFLLQTQPDNVSYNATGLLPDTTYTFHVRAVGVDAASSWSNEVKVGTFTAPLAPGNLDASAMGMESVRISWERASANEMYFELQRKIFGGSWALADTVGRGNFSVDDDGLAAGTTYSYRVRAVNTLGNSPWSNEDTTTTYTLPIPLKPFGFTATSTGTSSIHLSWISPPPQYQSGFEIQESLTIDDSGFQRITPDAEASAMSYDRAGLAAQTTYYYRIRAYNSSGSSDWSGIVSAKTLQQNLDLPGDPFNARAVALSHDEIEISWEMPSPSKEEGFELERSLTGDAREFTRIDPNPAPGARASTDAGLQPLTAYWYRVRAYNVHGFSQYSNIVSATTPRVPLLQQLSDAIQVKEALYPRLENLIEASDTAIATLRQMFGDYPHGYDEASARALIASWKNVYPAEQSRAAEAMQRYVLFEEVMQETWGDANATPAVVGVPDVAMQAGRAPALATKDLMALALAWKEERAFLVSDDAYVDAAME
ncbi:MAG: fibronectin type III domain-containing protein, partial [Bacteroidetes bacterium]|nr:fibronectin type III domain-containing protein [Bacteroidota bacterium]